MQNEPKNQEGLKGIGALHHLWPLRYMLSFFFEKRNSACGFTIPESPSGGTYVLYRFIFWNAKALEHEDESKGSLFLELKIPSTG